MGKAPGLTKGDTNNCWGRAWWGGWGGWSPDRRSDHGVRSFSGSESEGTPAPEQRRSGEIAGALPLSSSIAPLYHFLSPLYPPSLSLPVYVCVFTRSVCPTTTTLQTANPHCTARDVYRSLERHLFCAARTELISEPWFDLWRWMLIYLSKENIFLSRNGQCYCNEIILRQSVDILYLKR